MKKFDNDKVTVYRCKRCHKKIWVPESIIRGMGPICYGKSYAYRRLILKGLSREDILKISKEKIEELAKIELTRWRDEHKKIIKPKVKKIRTRKVKSKKDKNQRTIDLFLLSNKKSGSEGVGVSHGKNRELESLSDIGSNPIPSDLRDIDCKTDLIFENKNEKIEELKKELHEITDSLSKTMGNRQRTESDRALELMSEIRKLESEIEK